MIAEAIKQRLTMRQILGAYGIAVNDHGFARCPFHNEKTASFKAYDGDRGFYCFGCGESGDVITFVMKYFGVAFREAIGKINEDFSLGLPIGEKMDRRKRLDVARRAFERKQELKRAEEERLQRREQYDMALSEWVRLDRNKREYAPKTPGEAWHPLFTEALEKLAYQTYILDCAEMEVYDYAHRNN